jgi:ATP-binding cassette subfamily G (WHITE) protein 2 (SNQ2)
MSQPLINASTMDGVVNAKFAGMKQILFNLQGYAKPKEILAIMGGSGSGKTTTLNILAQRLGVLAGAKFDGEVKVNNRELTPQSFGKVGAYVLQDDILV